MPEEPDKKKRLWEVDPTMYKAHRNLGLLQRRIFPLLRQFGKWALIALAFAYPIYLVYIGLAFGGLAFWAFLTGSVAVIGVVISRLGFASNFRNWDIGMKSMGGVLLGFLVAAGFYLGLIYLKTWLIPVVLLVAGLGLYFAIRRPRS